ncbi:hypothetical protein PENSPDRAFT_758183 [Peniophora sp. CONT]|nr:hypothetical protein PENSPDRAFT_758183 [Peniophora sp. CONT]
MVSDLLMFHGIACSAGAHDEDRVHIVISGRGYTPSVLLVSLTPFATQNSSPMAPYVKLEEQFEHDSPVRTLQTIVDVRVFPLLLETGLIAIFTLQTIYFVYHRCAHKPRSPTKRHLPHNSMLCLSICMYLLALAYWILDVIIARQELLVFLPIRLSATPKTDVFGTLTQMLGVHWYAQTVLQILIWISSDGIVLWRAYAVLGKLRWLKITIIIIFGIEIGVYVDYVAFYLFVVPHPPQFIQHFRETTGFAYIIAPYLAAASTTVAVQIFATTLIAYKAWRVWKSRKGLFDGPGRVFRALAVLIESGVVYTLLWIWYVIATNDSIVGLTMTGWTDYYLMPLTAMYPTLVVMIVTLQDSVLANVETSPALPRHLPIPGRIDSPELKLDNECVQVQEESS